MPPFGIEAAAAVALASELLLVAGGLILVRRDLGLDPRFRLLWRAAAAAAAMAVVLALVSDLSLALLLPLGVLLYGLGLWLLGGLDPRRLGALRG